MTVQYTVLLSVDTLSTGDSPSLITEFVVMQNVNFILTTLSTNFYRASIKITKKVASLTAMTFLLQYNIPFHHIIHTCFFNS